MNICANGNKITGYFKMMYKTHMYSESSFVVEPRFSFIHAIDYLKLLSQQPHFGLKSWRARPGEI